MDKAMTAYRLDNSDQQIIETILRDDSSCSVIAPESIIALLEEIHNRSVPKQIVIVKKYTTDIDGLCDNLNTIKHHVSEKLKGRINRIIAHLQQE
jgi:hypothetical protein